MIRFEHSSSLRLLLFLGELETREESIFFYVPANTLSFSRRSHSSLEVPLGVTSALSVSCTSVISYSTFYPCNILQLPSHARFWLVCEGIWTEHVFLVTAHRPFFTVYNFDHELNVKVTLRSHMVREHS